VSTFPYVCREIMRAARGKAISGFVLVFVSTFVTLFAFSAFFLLAPASTDSEPLRWDSGRFMVRLAPAVTTEEAQSVYAVVRSLDGVTQVHYLFGEELDPQQTVGAFVVRTDGSSFDSVREAAAGLTAVTGIETLEEPVSYVRTTVPLAARAILLVLLVVGILGTLVAARFAYRRLLGTFSTELQLLYLSGAPDTTVLAPVFVVGTLGAVGAVLLVILVVCLLRVAAIASPDGALAASTLLSDGGRVLRVLVLNVPVGIVIGSLAGAVGVSLTYSTRTELR